MTVSVLDDTILTRMESHVPVYDSDDIVASLRKDNEFFKEMVDLVPATFYFDKSTKEKLFTNLDRNRNGTEVKDERKKRKHEGTDYKKQTKHAKFDPTQMMTVTKIQERLEQQDSTETNRKVDGKKEKKTHIIPAKSTTDSLEDLRERLQRKIETLRGKRKAMTGADYIERKRLKRRESKMKLKIRKQAAKGNVTKGDQVQHKKLPNGTPANSPQRPVFNKDGKMVFSKFDFSEAPKSPGEKKGEGKKNYKKLLEKVMKEKDQMAELSAADKDAAKVAKEKTAWKKALQMAEGIKVKDNPELLKKAIKQQEKKKKKVPTATLR